MSQIYFVCITERRKKKTVVATLIEKYLGEVEMCLRAFIFPVTLTLGVVLTGCCFLPRKSHHHEAKSKIFCCVSSAISKTLTTCTNSQEQFIHAQLG